MREQWPRPTLYARAPRPAEKCAVCHSTGIVPLEVPVEHVIRGGEQWREWMPCMCSNGDAWREEADIAVNPPACIDCGREAWFYGTPSRDRARCQACDRRYIAERSRV